MITYLLVCLTPVATDGAHLICDNGQSVHLLGIDAKGDGRANLQHLINGGIKCIMNQETGLCMNRKEQDVGEMQVRAGYASVE